ncbi:metallophosphoesterase [Enterovirga rhinocerotis]|uniref:Calcineurin-like phosphoesterase family protein n=1 Tax=Enterovirga rhinocerotis TaxID=1339210 RepID=A0A4R7BT79_9HYPH|nr:metallophosphoesterase [Enterovirga rhinocerotis]TDR87317.1 calcineurin-like phosphoesterase family protein [Enterovirga rhinocerotis]
MATRRGLMQGAAGAALVAPLMGFGTARAQTSGAPAVRFGAIADPQYAPVAPRRTRFYGNSLWKLDAAIAELNKADLQFCVTLGDIIDRHWESFSHILPIYDRLRHPNVLVLGNHDYEVGADWLGSVHRATGLKKPYYDFAAGGLRFIVVDGNDVSLFANAPGSDKHKLAQETLDRLTRDGAINAKRWNGGMSEEQITYLKTTLADAKTKGERVVVFGHYPVYPANEHNMWGWQDFVELLAGHDNVLAYFCGHNHVGNYGERAGIHFVNLKGMVETPDTTAFSIVEIQGDRLDLKGFGREESRSFKLRAGA